jgi:hypothetical protein
LRHYYCSQNPLTAVVQVTGTEMLDCTSSVHEEQRITHESRSFAIQRLLKTSNNGQKGNVIITMKPSFLCDLLSALLLSHILSFNTFFSAVKHNT